MTFAPTPPAVENASPAMPDVLMNGDNPPTVKGHDLIDLTQDNLDPVPSSTPLVDSTSENVAGPPSPSRDPSRFGQLRMASSPVEMALRTPGPTASQPNGQLEQPPSQKWSQRLAFSRYK